MGKSRQAPLVPPPSPISLASVLGERKVPESVALTLVEQLLTRAGSGVHPEGVQFQADGGLEIRPAPPSPGYRAPENRGRAPTEGEDVYVAGTIYYELLSGRRLGQLPEREILHATALDRALDELVELHTPSRMLLKAMLSFRPEARVDARLALQELRGIHAEGPTMADWMAEVLFVPASPRTAPPPRRKLRWLALVGCVGLLTMACTVGAVLALWWTTRG